MATSGLCRCCGEKCWWGRDCGSNCRRSHSRRHSPGGRTHRPTRGANGASGPVNLDPGRIGCAVHGLAPLRNRRDEPPATPELCRHKRRRIASHQAERRPHRHNPEVAIMPFPWSGSTGSPVAERVSRRGHVLDGGLALDWWSEDGVPLPWNRDRSGRRCRCVVSYLFRAGLASSNLRYRHNSWPVQSQCVATTAGIRPIALGRSVVSQSKKRSLGGR